MSAEIPEFTDKSEVKRPKLNVKPIFKLKISHLLNIVYDKINECFKFENNEVNIVMCCGRITDIFRDDSIFSFEIDDGSGTIRCFHKFKPNPEFWLNKFKEKSKFIRFLQTTFIPNQSAGLDNDTIFNVTENDTLIKKFENDTNEVFHEIFTWFEDEVIAKQKIRNVGDMVHVMGHLTENECVRKINVIDFRVIENENENKDFLLELDFLHKHVYS